MRSENAMRFQKTIHWPLLEYNLYLFTSINAMCSEKTAHFQNMWGISILLARKKAMCRENAMCREMQYAMRLNAHFHFPLVKMQYVAKICNA